MSVGRKCGFRLTENVVYCRRNTTEWKAVKASTQKRLLLACHRNLVWYDVDGDRYSILNDAHLIYYGMVPADAASKAVWVVSSKLETRKMKDKKDQLLRIDSHSGEVLEIKPLPSMFTHDAVQSSDGSKLYVADTSKGHILVYSFPDVTKIKALPGFKREHHINTLSPTSHGTIWVLLLNRKGKSFMVEIDANTGERLCIVKDLGEDCHGLVQLDDGVSFLMLSSSEAALMKVRIPRFCKKGDVLTADRTVLWQYKQSLVQKTVSPKFLKGLAVLDDVAYFGMSEYEGTREGRIALSCALLAFDLRLGKLLWIREKVGTRGLINVIGAPHLAQGSVYKQQWTDKGKAAIQASASKSECEKSYLQALTDSKHYGPAFGMPGPGIFFIELPLRFDLPRLRKENTRVGEGVRMDLQSGREQLFHPLGNPPGRKDRPVESWSILPRSWSVRAFAVSSQGDGFVPKRGGEVQVHAAQSRQGAYSPL